MPNGRRCHSPALRGMAYCYHHHKLHHALNRSKHSHPRVELPTVENRADLEAAIIHVCDALGQARIDKKRAGLMIQALQIATRLIAKTPQTAPQATDHRLSSTTHIPAPTQSHHPPNHPA